MMKRRKGRWSISGRPMELLEESHVEHVMDACSGRQREADGDVVDQLGDAIRPEEARLELAGDCLRER